LTSAWTSCAPSADSLADFGVPAANAVVDLTIARGLDYYTGTVYETRCSTIRRSARLLRRPI
jgi:histidyl-tRNA synthetase